MFAWFIEFDIPEILQFLVTLMHREVSHFTRWKT